MKDILSNSPQRLSEVNTLVATCNQDGFSFGRALSLSQFYRDFNDTNSLVKEAENLARENPARLLECSISLLSETDGYLSSDRSGLYAADFERIFEEHIKPFELRHEEAKSAATQLWRDYSVKSNRLDFCPTRCSASSTTSSIIKNLPTGRNSMHSFIYRHFLYS